MPAAGETGFIVLGACRLYLLARREWLRALLFGVRLRSVADPDFESNIRAVPSRSWLPALPLALVLPRILMQPGPQFLGLRKLL
jgi:hypothetical protein